MFGKFCRKSFFSEKKYYGNVTNRTNNIKSWKITGENTPVSQDPTEGVFDSS